MKYLVLYAAVNYVVDVPVKIAQIMGLPQLFTAILGGVIALITYKALRIIEITR